MVDITPGQRSQLLDDIMSGIPPIRQRGEDGEFLGITITEFAKELEATYEAARNRMRVMEQKGILEYRKERNPTGQPFKVYYKKGEMP